MNTRRWLSSALIAALVSTLAPATGWAAGAPAGRSDTSPARLRAAIRQEAVKAAATPSLQLQAKAVPAKASGARMQAAGGGGGHTMMIVSLVSTVVGVGATVYMVKQMQKTTKAAGY